MIEFGYKLMTEEHGPSSLVRNAVRAEQAGFEFAAISARAAFPAQRSRVNCGRTEPVLLALLPGSRTSLCVLAASKRRACVGIIHDEEPRRHSEVLFLTGRVSLGRRHRFLSCRSAPVRHLRSSRYSFRKLVIGGRLGA
jgi:hypothetical protein